MKCPYCGHPESRVTDSRDTGPEIRRRRECLHCGARFTTYERVQATVLMVRKRDGRLEEFHREKLRAGILKACAKRPVPPEAVDKVVEEIEQRLFAMGRAEVPSRLIGEMVLERLKALDPVAYIRFASVHWNFKDLSAFQRAIEALGNGRASLPEASEPARRARRPRRRAQPTLIPLDPASFGEMGR